MEKGNRIYISGQITGLPMDVAESNFHEAELKLKGRGYEPINPYKLVPYVEGKTWTQYMQEDIVLLMGCDKIYMMPDWKCSRGAQVEYNLAKTLGYELVFDCDL